MATIFTSHPEMQRTGVGVGQGLGPISEPQVHEATAPAPLPPLTPDACARRSLVGF